MQHDLNISRNTQEELSRELTVTYETMHVLKKTNNDRDDTIWDLNKKIEILKETAATLNNSYNINRVKFENEKLQLFKEHRMEVKAWKRDLGD